MAAAKDIAAKRAAAKKVAAREAAAKNIAAREAAAREAAATIQHIIGSIANSHGAAQTRRRQTPLQS